MAKNTSGSQTPISRGRRKSAPVRERKVITKYFWDGLFTPVNRIASGEGEG